MRPDDHHPDDHHKEQPSAGSCNGIEPGPAGEGSDEREHDRASVKRDQSDHEVRVPGGASSEGGGFAALVAALGAIVGLIAKGGAILKGIAGMLALLKGASILKMLWGLAVGVFLVLKTAAVAIKTGLLALAAAAFALGSAYKAEKVVEAGAAGTRMITIARNAENEVLTERELARLIEQYKPGERLKLVSSKVQEPNPSEGRGLTSNSGSTSTNAQNLGGSEARFVRPLVHAQADIKAHADAEIAQIASQCGGGGAGLIASNQLHDVLCFAVTDRIRTDCVSARSTGDLTNCKQATALGPFCANIPNATLIALGAACAGVKASAL